MNAKSMILGLAPWFVFAWAAERLGADHVTLAAIAACALALAVTIYEAVRTGGGWMSGIRNEVPAATRYQSTPGFSCRINLGCA